MGFHGDNGYARWITNSDWDTYAHGNLYTDGYCHSYSCTHSNTFTDLDGHSYRHGYSCTNGYSDAHNCTHADPNSYYYASTDDNTNTNANGSSAAQYVFVPPLFKMMFLIMVQFVVLAFGLHMICSSPPPQMVFTYSMLDYMTSLISVILVMFYLLFS